MLFCLKFLKIMPKRECSVDRMNQLFFLGNRDKSSGIIKKHSFLERLLLLLNDIIYLRNKYIFMCDGTVVHFHNFH